jgi:hypothetical protein
MKDENDLKHHMAHNCKDSDEENDDDTDSSLKMKRKRKILNVMNVVRSLKILMLI